MTLDSVKKLSSIISFLCPFLKCPVKGREQVVDNKKMERRGGVLFFCLKIIKWVFLLLFGKVKREACGAGAIGFACLRQL